MATLKSIKSQEKAAHNTALLLSPRRKRFVVIVCLVIVLLVLYLWIGHLNSSIIWLQGISVSVHQGMYMFHVCLKTLVSFNHGTI